MRPPSLDGFFKQAIMVQRPQNPAQDLVPTVSAVKNRGEFLVQKVLRPEPPTQKQNCQIKYFSPVCKQVDELRKNFSETKYQVEARHPTGPRTTEAFAREGWLSRYQRTKERSSVNARDGESGRGSPLHQAGILNPKFSF